MKNNQNYDSSASADEESKKETSLYKNRRAKQIADRRINTRRQNSRRKRQKIDEEDNEEFEIEIPKEYINMFHSFKWFIDELTNETVPEQSKPSPPRRTVKGRNAAKIKEKAIENASSQNVNDSFNENSEQNHSIAEESQLKILQDAKNTQQQIINKEVHNEEAPEIPQSNRIKDFTGIQLDQQNVQNNSNSGNNQELIMNLLFNQGNIGQQNANFNQFSGLGGNPQLNQMNAVQALQENSQSLLLLQRIIQTTPEIHLLHQQEQLELYRIQQNIKAALTQNLGQEIISHLVLEYQKTQEQHQLNIQTAIQRKLTMILCQSYPQFMNNAQQASAQNEYLDQQEEPLIEKNIFNYSRSSYHLGIAYYIYNEKNNAYKQQARMQENARMQQAIIQNKSEVMSQRAFHGMHPSMIHVLKINKNAQRNAAQTSRETNQSFSHHVNRACEDSKNSTKDINSKIDDLMNS